MSCATPTFCVVATSSSEDTSHFNGTSWLFWANEQLNMSDTGFDGNLSLSCSSTSLYAAVYGDSEARVFNGQSWSTPRRIVSNALGIDALSCSSLAFCEAASSHRAMTYDGRSWSAPVPIAINACFQLESVSCPSSTFCMAVDNVGQAFTFGGSGWSDPVEIDRGAVAGDVFPGGVSVSCPSPSMCVAASSVDAFVWRSMP